MELLNNFYCDYITCIDQQIKNLQDLKKSKTLELLMSDLGKKYLFNYLVEHFYLVPCFLQNDTEIFAVTSPEQCYYETEINFEKTLNKHYNNNCMAKIIHEVATPYNNNNYLVQHDLQIDNVLIPIVKKEIEEDCGYSYYEYVSDYTGDIIKSFVEENYNKIYKKFIKSKHYSNIIYIYIKTSITHNAYTQLAQQLKVQKITLEIVEKNKNKILELLEKQHK